MQEFRTFLRPGVPASAKVFGWVLVFAGLFFAYVYTQSPGGFFPGVSIATNSEKFGLYSTGVRILGSVLGLAIALMLDSAALLALMLATRVFIELGDVMVGLIINRAPDANTVTLAVLAAVEIYFVLLLLRTVRNAGRGK